MSLVYAVILLGIIIFVHEVGHFLFAKLSGVKVLKFSLGFGPKIFGKKIGETEYLICWLPLGGYVKMLGEEPGEEFDDSEKERTFGAQSLYKRAMIVVAGPLFNIFFASLVFMVIFMSGVPRLTALVGEVTDDTPAARAGLLEGDRIIAINDREIRYWDEMQEIIHERPEEAVTLKVERNNESFSLSLTPERKVVKNIFGEDTEIGLIGITAGTDSEEIVFGLFEAVQLGVKRTVDIVVLTLVAIVKLVQRIIPADTIGGPVMIFQMAKKQAAEGLAHFLTLMAVISINLGIINLFPIPILDGGHIMFMGIEAVRRKPLSEKTLMIAQRIGLALILALMAFAFYNDFLRIFSGKPLP